MEIRCMVVLVLLGIQSIWDMWKKEILLILTLMGAICGVGFSIYQGRSLMEMLLALLPGGIFLFLGRLTRQAVGYGDGILLLAMGLLLNSKELWSSCVVAIFLAGTGALILLLLFRKKGSYEIPFVPFLFLGTVIVLYEMMGG